MRESLYMRKSPALGRGKQKAEGLRLDAGLAPFSLALHGSGPSGVELTGRTHRRWPQDGQPHRLRTHGREVSGTGGGEAGGVRGALTLQPGPPHSVRCWWVQASSRGPSCHHLEAFLTTSSRETSHWDAGV